MKSLRTRTVVAAVGAVSVASSLAGAVSAVAVPSRTAPVVTFDDDGTDEVGCLPSVLASMVAASPEVTTATRALRSATTTAAHAAHAEVLARRALTAGARTSAAHRAHLVHAVRLAHARTLAARRAVVRARAALTIATRNAQTRIQAAGCLPSAAPVPTPNPVPTTPPGPQVPGQLAAPTGLIADTATSQLSGAFRLHWVPVAGATSYKVYRGTTLLGTTAATTYVPAGVTVNTRASYTVVATAGTLTSPASAAISAGHFQGTAHNDQLGRTVYGTVVVHLAVTGTRATGCWAVYPASGTSNSISGQAAPVLCSEALTAQSGAIASVSGASAFSNGFLPSATEAFKAAGI